MLYPDLKLSNDFWRWRTVKEISFFPNGLVNDIEYYIELEQRRDYKIASYSNLNSLFKELHFSDYDSVRGKSWLTSFAVTIAINLLNVNCEYQVLDEPVVSVIFSESSYSEYFLDKVRFSANKIAMPLLRGAHFCLIIADFDTNYFSFLDPFGATEFQVLDKFQCFKRFVKIYNTTRDTSFNTSEMHIKTYHHIKQRDDYNCGPYIIYYFQQIVLKEPLTDFIDIDNYRQVILNLFLSKSNNVSNNCLFCLQHATSDNSEKCLFCMRLVHKQCLAISSVKNPTNFIRYNMCDICRKF